MTRLFLTLGALTVMFFSSCKKDKKVNPDPPQKIDDVIYLDYTRHLKEGNYWIYQIFDVDTFGNATPTMQYDSIYAAKDTVINGRTFKVLMDFDGSAYYKRLTRDSLHYQLNQKGQIEFSSIDFKNILRSYYREYMSDTVSLNTLQMTDRGAKTTVPAGTFETITRTERWNMYPAYRNGGVVRKLKTCYNIDIGIISETQPFYLMMPSLRERRLVRYYVK